MRIALDQMTIEHTRAGEHPGLTLIDDFGNSVELYVHSDPGEAFMHLSGLMSAVATVQYRLDPSHASHDMPRLPL